MCGSTPAGFGGFPALTTPGDWARVSSSGDLQLVLEVGQGLLGLVEGDVAALHQRLDIELAHAAPLGDRLVHQRLGVARVVALVVAVAPVAPHVDDDVLVELLAVLERHARHTHAGLRIVAVDVEDRCLHRLGHVAAVEGRPGELRRRGVADLVVDDQVDRAADPIAGDVAHRQRFGHHSLPGEGGVTVEQEGQDGIRAWRVDLVLRPLGSSRRRPGRPPRGGSGWRRARGGCRTPEGLTYLPVAPRWYLTSPEPCTESGSMWPSNSRKIAS